MSKCQKSVLQTGQQFLPLYALNKSHVKWKSSSKPQVWRWGTAALFCLLFISTAFCQHFTAGIIGGNRCLDHADDRISFVLWGFCISVLWPQSHLSINHMIHLKEQVWPCSPLSSGTAVDTTSTEAWQSFKIYLEVPWSFKIGLWLANGWVPSFWRHTELHGLTTILKSMRNQWEKLHPVNRKKIMKSI